MTITQDTSNATTISTAIGPISASRALDPKLNIPTMLNTRIIILRYAWAFSATRAVSRLSFIDPTLRRADQPDQGLERYFVV